MPRSAASADLAEQQRLDHRVADRADDLVGEQLGDLQLLGREVDGLVDPAELDERDHRVQPVGGLVVLGAERVAEAADHVQLAGHRPQLGVVAQGDHGTDVGALPGGGGGAHDQDPVAREVDVVGLGGPSERRLHQPGREAELGQRAAEDVVGQVQQPACLVVDELDPASGVEQQQSLADRAEHRRVVLVHPGDLGGAEPVRLAAQPASDQPGAGQPDSEHEQRRDPDQLEVVCAAACRSRRW